MLKSSLRKYRIFGIIAIVLLFSEISFAQIKKVVIRIDGLACPFCAYGVEKKLKKVAGVESLIISMKEGTATLSAEEGRSININKVPKAVKDAGFTPAKINITTTGIIKVVKEEQLLLQINGFKQRFMLMDLKDTTKVQFISYSKAGISIKITGIVHQHADGSWGLSLKTFEEVK